MNTLTFPEGITYKYNYTSFGDFTPVGYIIEGYTAYTYYACKNSVIDISYDTSKVTDMSYMFCGCINLNSVTQFSTSKVTNMRSMFYNCSNLTSIPQFDTSKVTNMENMFYSCKKLTSIPQLDTSKVTNMGYMFQNCTGLKSVPELDTSSVTGISQIWGSSNINSLTHLGGFKNLGAQSSLYGTSSNFLDKFPNLTKESLMNVINNLYDRKSAGYSTVTLKLGTTHLAALTDEEKAIATNKGWTLA